MTEMTQEQREKKTDVIAQHATTQAHLLQVAMKKLTETPEGREATHLRVNILEGYLKDLSTFLEHFISGPPGQRGVDIFINGLEHPDSDINKDEKLLKKVKLLSEEIKKVKLPDIHEWNHYNALLKLLNELSPSKDIHDFRKDFNSLLVDATRYPETEVGKAIKEYSAKRIPHILEVENFELAILVWKFMLSKLYLPFQEAGARQVIGQLSSAEMQQRISDKLVRDKNLQKSVKVTAKMFNDAVAVCFPEETETEGWANLNAFADNLAKEKANNAIMKLLIESGYKEFTAHMIEKLSAKGVRDQKYTVNSIAEIIKRLRKGQNSIKKSAKDELMKLISTMLDRMKKDLKTERDRFAEVLKARIEEIEKKHAKHITTLREMTDEADEDVKLLGKEIRSEETVERQAKMIVTSKNEYYVRAEDILRVTMAHTLFRQLRGGWIQDDRFRFEMAKLQQDNPSDFVIHTIDHMQKLFDRVKQGTITLEEFQKRMHEIDDYTDKLAAQLRQIAAHQKATENEYVRLRAEYDDTGRMLDFDLKRIEDKMVSDFRKIKKMGIDFEHYQEELTPQDMAFLTRN